MASKDRMPRFRTRGMLAKSASEDLFRHTLARLPTIYGRLAYLSSLRDPNTGIYRHHGLSAQFGREDAANALRGSHESTFREWISLNLRDQYHDLAKYMDALELPRLETVRHWAQTRIYCACVPPSASKAEKDLFSAEIEAVLEAFSSGAVFERRDPESSQPE
jgi:hypothetical protein